jgi:hypothetical protein
MKQILVARKKHYANRSERKKLEKEYRSNIKDFEAVEGDFIEALHDPKYDYEAYPYKNIYRFYLEWWNKSILYADSIHAFKLTKLNEHYFEEMYKPLEKPIEQTYFDTLLSKIRSLGVSGKGSGVVFED